MWCSGSVGVLVVRMVVTARVRAEKRVEFLQAMDSLKRASWGQPPCGNFTITPGAHEADLFSISLEWTDEQRFEHCLGTEAFSVFLGGVRVLCEDAKFSSNSVSEKWARIPGIQRESLRDRSVTEKSKTPQTRDGK